MALFGQAQKGQAPGFDWGAAALTFLGAGPLVQARRQRELEQARLALQQQVAEQALQERNNQIWGAKESGVSNPNISVLSPSDLSQTMRERLAPYSQSPNETRVTPSVGGGADQRVTAAPAEANTYNWLNGLPNGAPMAQSYAERQAYPAPVSIQPGGNAIGFGPTGPHYLVQPDGAGAAPPAGGNGAGNNNPGGLRVPGTSRFQTFQTMAAGVSAQEQLLRGNYLNHPNTIRQIVERYAPRRSRGGDNTDEQVDNYIAYVSQQTGISPDQSVDANYTAPIARAMRGFETGRRAPSPRPSARAPRLQTAQAGGRTFYRINGRWYDNPEGR